MVVTDSSVAALSLDKAPDKELFEKSLKDFLKNDKLNASVTLYTDINSFLKKEFPALRQTLMQLMKIKTDRMGIY